MRIVHLACVAPPVTGGIGRVAHEEVIRLQAQGHDAVLASPVGGGDPRQVVRLPAYIRIGNAAVARWRQLSDLVRDADIVHLHYPFYGTAELVAYLRRRGVIRKLVITLHMDAQTSGPKGWIFSLHRMFFQKWILAAADTILCASKDYLHHASFSYLANDPRVREIPFGVDTQVFTPGSKERERCGLPEYLPMVGFVGGMDAAHAFKGIDVLLKAIARLPANVHLQLTGYGSLRAKYEKQAQELGIQDRCHFLGKARDGELPSLYRSMDVLAFPSTSQAEAFGLVALEAQACGIPVVASDLPGVREVVQDKQTGFLVPVGDVEELAAHLRLLLESPEMRHSFGQAAHQRIGRDFSWETHMQKLVSVYQGLS